MNKFTPDGRSTSIVAETFVTVICSQLSNIAYIFRNCDLLVLNKGREKKRQDKSISVTDCHTESYIVVTDSYLSKKYQIVFILKQSLLFELTP